MWCVLKKKFAIKTCRLFSECGVWWWCAVWCVVCGVWCVVCGGGVVVWRGVVCFKNIPNKDI